MAVDEREERKKRIDIALREWNPWWDTGVGVNVSLGVGASIAPLEFHGIVEYAWVF